MELTPEGVMHIDTGIEIGLDLIATDLAAEQLAAPAHGAVRARAGKPFPSGATPRAELARSMSIGFTRHHPHRIRLRLCAVSDFALELIGLLAIELARLAHRSRLHLAQTLKNQHTARILLADRDDLACHLVGHAVIHALDMAPDVLVAPLSFDRFA